MIQMPANLPHSFPARLPDGRHASAGRVNTIVGHVVYARTAYGFTWYVSKVYRGEYTWTRSLTAARSFPIAAAQRHALNVGDLVLHAIHNETEDDSNE